MKKIILIVLVLAISFSLTGFTNYRNETYTYYRCWELSREELSRLPLIDKWGYPVPPPISCVHWRTPAPQYSVGGAVWYDPQVMEATAQWRGMSLKGYLDGVALISPEDIGKTVWLDRGHGWEGPFLVVDCAMRGDAYSAVKYRKEVVEVGWKTAHRWGLGPHDGGWRLDNVKVWVGSKPPQIMKDPLDNTWLEPVNYADWWLKLG